ncbi:MAG TPA: carboxypeptidase-like regulatory domain-containing protein, partial [Blastocatellia bacterium]|nr:carboxypeptidase-like regulatory domain-containing protein [Blastocatellia bacterium]
MIHRIIRSVFILLALAAVGRAQDFRGTISGLVTDSNGDAVAGAVVKAVSVSTNAVKETKTTTEGHYTLPYLDPGVYNIEVRATGYQILKREQIVVRVADKLNLPLQLTIGEVTEAVVVMGRQEVIETSSADRGLVFEPVKVQELPLNGRQ